MSLSNIAEEKRYLVRCDIIHSLINCIMYSCSESVKESPKSIVLCKNAIEILYNLSEIHPSPYMNKMKKSLKNKIIQWGGFVTLLYIERNTQLKPIKDICEKLAISEILKGKKLKAAINSISEYLQNKSELNLPNISGKEENQLALNKKNLFPEYYYSKK